MFPRRRGEKNQMPFFSWLTVLFHPRRAFLIASLILFSIFFFTGTSFGNVVISSHTDSPDPVAAHGIVTYTIVVSNNDLGAGVSNVTLTDSLPASILFVDITPPAGVTCGGVAVGGTGTLTCTGLSLAAAGNAGDSATFVVRVRTTAASRAAGTITNSATVTDGVTPFTQDQTTTVNPGSDVALTKSGSPSPVVAGGVVSYTYSLTNNGPDNASSMIITDSLPPNCLITGSLPAGCTSLGQAVTCNVATLANGATTNVTPIPCIAGVAGGSTLTNTASVAVGAASPDNLTANNTSSVSIPVDAGTDVSIVKTKSLASVFVGDSFNFVLTPQYSGDFPAGATMTDVVPAQFTITSPASFSQNGWNCTVSSQTVSCTRSGSGSAGVNQALGVVNIGVTATAAGSFSNTASIAAPAGVTDPTPGNNSSTLSFTVAPLESNFSSTKTRTVPNAVPQNVPFAYTLAARNNGPSAFTGTVTLTDTLPAGFTLNSYGAASGFTVAGCTPAAASLPVAGPVTITCSRSVTNLAANTSAGSIVINVTPTGTGTLSNTVCVSTPVGGPPDLTPGNDCATNVVDSQINTDQADLRVNKTASPATVDAGQPLTYTVEVVNDGPHTAQNALVTDALSDLINGTIGAGQGVEAQPVIVPGVATVPASGSAACRIVSTSGTAAQLNCTITTLPVCTAGVDCPTFTFIIRPAASANPSNADVSRTNTASVLSQLTADPNTGNNSGSVTTNVSPRVDMTVTKTGSPGTVPVGQNLRYTITPRNNGPSRASGVSITDTLPDNVTYIGINSISGGGTCTTSPTVNTTTSPGNDTLICSWASQFNANTQQSVTVDVRPNYVTRGTTLTNSVTVSTSTIPETNAANNTATATTNVSNPAYDLLINKTDNPDPITVGDDVTYTVTVTNNGASYAENVRVVDTLPAAGLSFQSYSPVTAGVSCSTTATVGVIGGTVTCDIPGLAPTATAQFRVVLHGETKGTYNNVAVVKFQDATADAYDPQANNTATEPTTVRTRSDVQVVSKQAVQTGTATPLAQVEFRRPFDWLVSVQNNGPAEADTVTFADTLPAGMELTGTPVFTVTAGSFTPAAPTCTGSLHATSFSCSITSMPASGTATVRIPVRVITVPGGGTTTNTATIVTTGSFDTNGGSNPNAGNNFGSGSITVLSSSLAGRVYRDINDNGVVDAGETGISGATITVTGIAFDGTAINSTTTTDGSGNFSFAGLPESNGTGYTITETNGNLPVGYVDGKDSLSGSAIGTVGNDVFTGIVLAGNTALSGYLFGETPGVTISGSVLNDTDASHTSNAGDTPISGVTMTLTGTNDRGQPVNCSLSTTGGGSFSFTAVNCTNLRAGNFTVTEMQPAGYLPGYTLVGTATGIGSSPGTLSGGVTGNTIQGILLPPGGTSTNNIFLEELPATIAGNAYFDLNGNAIKDPGETVGVPNVTIVLSGTNDLGQTVSCTIITGGGGAYQFPKALDANPLCQTLRPGTYTLTETKPANISSTGAQPGIPINGTAGSTAFTQTISNIVITGAGNALTNYNFGHQGTALGGYVYVDINNNGVRDGESGIPGVAVTISGTAAAGGSVCDYLSSCTVTTDTNGYYSFASLPGSDTTGYTITERDGSGVASPVLSNYANGITSRGTVAGILTGVAGNDVITGIVINTGQVGADYRFGELGGSLTGRVYLDVNQNNAYDPGTDTGIAGVKITLSGNTANSENVCTVVASVYPTCSVTTAADGSYRFTGLPASNGAGYTLTESQPDDYADNSDPSLGTPAGTSKTGTTISHIPLTTAVSTGTNYLFGEKTGSINGFVYHDANDDGIKDAGETGISGVTLTLTGTSAGGVPVTQTAITVGDGSYSFTGLRNANASGYTITETQPTAYLDGRETVGTQGGTVDNTGFDSTPPRNRISAIPFSAAAPATGYNFGEVLSGSISGRVYHDANLDSFYQVGEELAGVTITLTGNDDQGHAVNMVTTTASDGTYLFTGLRPSDSMGYILTETQPTGIGDFTGATGTQVGSLGGTAVVANVISAIPLASGNAGINYNFREKASSLQGYVYLDADNSGTKGGAGEPGIAGVEVKLTGTDANGAAVNRTTITAADGSYQFIGLTGGGPANYTLTETQPVIYQDGKETAGTAGGTVDNTSFTSDPAQNRISNIPLTVATAGSGYLFGERTGLTGSFSGKVWYNSITRDQTHQPGEPWMAGWRVDVKRGGVVQGSAVTATDGTWMVSGLAAATGYEIVFRHPTNNAIYGIPVSQDLGYHDSVPDYSAKTIANMVLRSGGNVINQNLPIDPSGVVYDSITRLPVAGATVAIAGPPGFNAATQLAGGVTNQSQVTNATGFYQFLLLSVAPSGTYRISITPPAGYIPGPSAIIPPTAGPYSVPGGPPVAIQVQPTPPTGAQPTTYYFSFTMSGTSSVVNNHIPVDPILGGAIIATKTTPLVNVKRGDLVPYTITMTNTLSATIPNIDVRDLMPPGFKYRTGSGTINGVRTEPLVAGRELIWRNLTFTKGEKKTFLMILVVGSGVSEAEYTNQVYAANNIVNKAVSNIATATVRVIPDPTFDCPDIIGKVFDDKNTNGYQDEGEPGIANVRLATVRGLIITTDADGRFHIPCPEIPNENRGSNFILKLDDRTLPSGYRITTENPLVVRLTRGKMTKMNFGATVHRVVRIDVNAAAFEKEGTKLLEEWQQKIRELEKQLHERPTVVRIAYRMGAESKSLVDLRIKKIREMLEALWKKGKDYPPLVFEEEIVEVR